ncbi:MAG: ROK family protein [Gammaproteobacteria bacterium]|nr:ROK family protein [Gammaproteobacteria bacterium]
MTRFRLGIDLGGTKIEAVVLGPDGAEIVRRRVDTPKEYQALLSAIADLVQALESATGQSCLVGVGTPGAISPASGLMKNCNTTALLGQDLMGDLQSLLNRPVRISNDANCFAVSEATDGAGAGAKVVFGVIIGTGCGGGVVVDGLPLEGANAIAGEWGHNPLPWPRVDELPGPLCYCGRRGCIETYLSGPGLLADYRGFGDRAEDARGVVELAAVGDGLAEAALLRYEERMARALSSVINLLDPEVIVLGGGLSRIDRLYQNVPRLWGNYVFSDRVDTRLVPPRFGDASGVRGAAWLWPPDFNESV